MMYNQYKQYKQPEEKFLGEETEEAWLCVPGSRVEIQANRRGFKLYTEAVLLTTQGKLTKTIFEYKPMLNMFMYSEDQKKLAVYLNPSRASVMAATFDILIQPATQNAYFAKTITTGWSVRAESVGKNVISKPFTKNLSVDFQPFVDERKLPAYKMTWHREGVDVAIILSMGEIKLLTNMIYQFIGNAPMYASRMEDMILRDQIQSDISKVAQLQQTVYNLSAQINNMEKMFETLKTSLSHDISIAVSAAITTMSAYNRLVPSVPLPVIPEAESPVPVVEPTPLCEDGEGEESIRSDIQMSFDIDSVKDVADLGDIPSDLLQGENALEESVPLYLADPFHFGHDPKLEGAETLADVFAEDISNNVPITESVLTLEDVDKEKNKNIQEDSLVKTVSKLTHKEFVMGEPEKSNQLPVTILYPEEVVSKLGSNVERTQPHQSSIPKGTVPYNQMINSDPDLWLQRWEGDVKGSTFRSVPNWLVDTKCYHAGNLSGMLINRGRVGIPATSALSAIAWYATAYEMMDPISDNLGKMKISSNCANNILSSFVEQMEENTAHLDVYHKYFNYLIKSVMGEEATSWKDVLAADKMLQSSNYEYSYFKMNLDQMSPLERSSLMHALTDVYLLLWYTSREHIVLNSQTTPNPDLYALVNKQMYRFVRAILTNVLLNNARSDKSLILAVEQSFIQFKETVKRMEWLKTLFDDALISFLVTFQTVREFIGPDNEPVDGVNSAGYINDTMIYVGLPCKEIQEALK